MGTQGLYNERGPSLAGSFGSQCRYKRFLSCLGCSSLAIKNTFFPQGTQYLFVPVAHTVKKVENFPVPSRDVTNQTLPGRDKLFNYFRPVIILFVTSRRGTEKSLTFFTVYQAGQAVVPHRLSLNKCLWYKPTLPGRAYSTVFPGP